MVGREREAKIMKDLLRLKRSYFLTVTGRRRVGKTFLIDTVYKNHLCFQVTGIQDGDMATQIHNFIQKLAEHIKFPIVTIPRNWQEAYALLKSYLKTLPKTKKQVIFIDELPWMSTPRSGFIQLLAHLWNDYLSKEKHFILVVCGSATSWIAKKIINDKGGFHNRVSHNIKLQPFTLSETRRFLESKKIKLTANSITELYMVMGGIPLYLDYVEKGESPSVAIDRLCFSDGGALKYEYDNLYKALFDYPENHESIVKALAQSRKGLTRDEILLKSKVHSGGPYTRAMNDLLVSGFIQEETPFGRKKRGAIYRLVDEYSVFYHKFIHTNKKSKPGLWTVLSASQKYKIWTGYAFETLCQKHVHEIKKALGIEKVYTETSSFRESILTNKAISKSNSSVQIDLIIDRNDKSINLCECKFYSAPFILDKKYAQILISRKAAFRSITQTRKQIFTTLITNFTMKMNEYSLEAVDNHLTISDLM